MYLYIYIYIYISISYVGDGKATCLCSAWRRNTNLKKTTVPIRKIVAISYLRPKTYGEQSVANLP